MGATLLHIKYKYPNSTVKGIELEKEVVEIGSNYLDIRQGNIESDTFPFKDEKFDYIIMGDVIEHLYNPEKVIDELQQYLKDDGSFICSIPNVLHYSVMFSLLQGRFEYEDSGILDRTHIRFFTLNSICRMFLRLHLSVEDVNYTLDAPNLGKQYYEFLKLVNMNDNIVDNNQFIAYQYVFRAEKIKDEKTIERLKKTYNNDDTTFRIGW